MFKPKTTWAFPLHENPNKPKSRPKFRQLGGYILPNSFSSNVNEAGRLFVQLMEQGEIKVPVGFGKYVRWKIYALLKLNQLRAELRTRTDKGRCTITLVSKPQPIKP